MKKRLFMIGICSLVVLFGCAFAKRSENTFWFHDFSADGSDGSGYFFDDNNNVLTKIASDSGDVLVSIDKGKNWLTITEYEKQYPDYPKIPYRNRDEYQTWINENIKKEQDGYFEKTGGKGWQW